MSGMALKLYDITEARFILDDFLWESEGEMTPEVEALLGELELQADEKIQHVGLYIRELDAATLGIKAERDRLAYLIKRNETSARSLRDYLLRHMDALNKTKVSGPLITVAVQQNPASVVGDVPEEYLSAWFHEDVHQGLAELVRHVPESFQLDKKAVAAYAQAGHELPAGLSITHTRSVRLK